MAQSSRTSLAADWWSPAVKGNSKFSVRRLSICQFTITLAIGVDRSFALLMALVGLPMLAAAFNLATKMAPACMPGFSTRMCAR